MGRLYELAYRLGVTPWKQAGRDSGFVMQLCSLLDQESVELPTPAKALDMGCGTGEHSIDLAKRGWKVTGLDSVERAVEQAWSKARAANVDAEFLQADVTDFSEVVGTGYRLALDVGCFHGLNGRDRHLYARELTAVSNPGAILLMFAFSPGRRGPLPSGASRADVEQTFTEWRVVGDEDADCRGLPAPIGRTAPRWFRLIRED